jgi:hypothetical protein
MGIRLANRFHPYLMDYAEAMTWPDAMEVVERHFQSGGTGHFAIFRYPVGSRAWYAHWIIVRTA